MSVQLLLSLAIDAILPDPNQPRKSFGKGELERLAESIAAHGLLSPLRVRKDEERDAWIIVFGERRWRAAKLAGLQVVSCIKAEGEPSEADGLAEQLVENLAREDIPPMEAARGIIRLKTLRGCNSSALAKELGVVPATITRAEALISLPEEMQKAVDAGRLPESSAYELSRLEDTDAQKNLFRQIVAGKRLTRDEVAEAVRERIGKRPAKKPERLPLKLDGGVSVTFSSEQPLTLAAVTKAIDQLKQAARKLGDGDEIGALIRILAS